MAIKKSTMKSKKKPKSKSKKKKTVPNVNNNWEYSPYYRLAKLVIEDTIII